MKLQEAANRALDAGLRRVDRVHGFRKPRRNVLAERHTLEGFKHPRWERPIGVGDIVPAVVTDTDAASIDLRAGRYRLTIDKKGFAWTRRANATQLVKPGDLVEAKLLTLDEAAGTATASLDQPPLVEGAILAIDNRTGQIKAHGRRLQLRTQQVQPRDAGVPPGRLRRSSPSSIRRRSIAATRRRRCWRTRR